MRKTDAADRVGGDEARKTIKHESANTKTLIQSVFLDVFCAAEKTTTNVFVAICAAEVEK